MTYRRDTPKILTCTCCGKATKGRQWWNQDRGFGICYRCLQETKNGPAIFSVPEYIYCTYGKEHYNFNLKE